MTKIDFREGIGKLLLDLGKLVFGAHCSGYSHTSYARLRAVFGILRHLLVLQRAEFV